MQRDYRDRFEIQENLLAAMVEGGIITESRSSIILSKSTILMEETIMEEPFVSDGIPSSKQKAPTRSNMGKEGWYQIAGRPVDVHVFSGVWVDYQRYPTWKDVAMAVGFNDEEVSDRSKLIRDGMNVLAHYAYATGKLDDYVTTKYRATRYGEPQRAAMFDSDDPRQKPDMDDIFGGRGGVDNSRTGRFVRQMNDEELFTGQFYSNVTRIPKSRWQGWLRFWDREKTSVAKDATFIGKNWKKTFLIGYQVDKNVFFEIWYNSLDSTFSVHDGRGNPVSARMDTMSEQTKYLFQFILRKGQANTDADVATSNNTATAMSVQRSLSKELTNDSRLQQMKKLEQEQQREFKKKAEERQRKIDAIKQRASGTTHAAARIAADKMDDAIHGGRKAVGKAAKSQYDYAKNRKADVDFERQRAASEKMARQQKRRNEDDFRDIVGGPRRRPKDDFEYEIPSFRGIRESIGDTMRAFDDEFTISDEAQAQENAIQSLGNSGSYKSDIQRLRRDAISSPYTKGMLKDDATNLIQDYHTTRSKRGAFQRIFTNFFRGRNDVTVLPTDFRPLKWLTDKILGRRYVANFIIGFNVNNKMAFEVWYITEPNPDHKWSVDDLITNNPHNTTVSSYYVYDVNSQRIIRSYLPHYRHALTQIMMKIGIF